MFINTQERARSAITAQLNPPQHTQKEHTLGPVNKCPHHHPSAAADSQSPLLSLTPAPPSPDLFATQRGPRMPKHRVAPEEHGKLLTSPLRPTPRRADSLLLRSSDTNNAQLTTSLTSSVSSAVCVCSSSSSLCCAPVFIFFFPLLPSWFLVSPPLPDAAGLRQGESGDAAPEANAPLCLLLFFFPPFNTPSSPLCNVTTLSCLWLQLIKEKVVIMEDVCERK